MSKVEKTETETMDAKKLALRCKTLEMQLRQSVPTKDHNLITSRLERQVSELQHDLDRARTENAKTVAINKQISGVEALINSMIKTASAQCKTLDTIEEEGAARGKALTTQGTVLDKLAQGTVPSQVYLQSLAKIRDLEEDKRNMVRRFEYNSLQARCDELSSRMGTMVPSADLAALQGKLDEATRQIESMVPASDLAAMKSRVEELEGTVASMVPREQFAFSENRARELESALAERVPQSTYDELVAKVMSLAEAVSGGAVQPEDAVAESPAVDAVVEPVIAPVAEPAVVEEQRAEPVVEVVVEAPAVEAPAPESIVAAPVAEEIVPIAEPAAPFVSPEQSPPVEPVGPIAPEISAPVAAEPILEAAPQPATEAAPEAVPEVREIQSQLQELKTQSLETRDTVTPRDEVEIVADSVETAPETAVEESTPEIAVSSESSETTDQD